MKPFMKLPTVNVYLLRDVALLKNMVQLIKWLEPTKTEFDFLEKEYHRIKKDKERDCYIVYNSGQISLYVNDVTNGAFDRMGDEER